MTEPLSRVELASLYRELGPAVYRRAVAVTRDEAEAWDTTQEVFERLISSPGSFRRESSPMTFLYRLATNLALNRLRSRSRREAVHRSAVPPGGDAGVLEARNLVDALCRHLDPESLHLAWLHYVDGLTQDQMTPLVGLSRKTIGKKLAHIRGVAEQLAGGRSHD